MVEKESTTIDDAPNTTDKFTDTIAPHECIPEDELIEDICLAMLDNPEEAKQERNNEEIIEKYYSDLKIVFEKNEADKLPPNRDYDIARKHQGQYQYLVAYQNDKQEWVNAVVIDDNPHYAELQEDYQDFNYSQFIANVVNHY